MRPWALFIFLLLPSSLLAQWSGIISPTRATDWTTAGVQGGIPDASWPVYATESPVGTASSPVAPTAINAALVAACSAHPSGSVVVLAAGSYYLSSGIWLPCNNVALRGVGANLTLLYFSGGISCWVNNSTADICMWDNSTVYSGAWGEYGKLSGTLSQGTTSITLTTGGTTGLVAGAPIILDACNTGLSGNSTSNTNPGCGTGTQTDNGNLFFCDLQWNGSTGCNGSTPTGNYRAGRAQQEVHVISSVSCTGSGPYTCTIGLESNGLMLPNWASVSSPEAWWADTASKGNGIENLSIDNGVTIPPGAPETIAFSWEANSWLTGVRSIMGHKIHVDVFMSAHININNNYFYGVANPGTTSYALAPDDSGYIFACNNIFQHITAPMAADGPDAGSVYCYNYSTDDAYGTPGQAFNGTQFQASEEPHSAGDVMELFEGNEGVGFNADDIHGTEDMQTLFRNVYSYLGVTGNINGGPPNPVQFAAFQRYENVIGNVLGYNSAQTGTYQFVGNSSNCASQPSLGSSNPIYFLNCMGNEFGPADPTASTSLFRWGNYDVKTGAVRWCGNSGSPGWATTCGSTSEVPTGAPVYPNSVPSSTTLPPSFVLPVYSPFPSGGTGIPFWKVCDAFTTFPTCAGYATPAYPPNGPDVVGGNRVNGYANDIPAVIAFNALPVDPKYQSTFAITAASCSNSLAKVTVSIPTGNFPSGWMQITGTGGAPPAGYDSSATPTGEWNMTGTSTSSGNLTTASFYVPSCPSGTATGTAAYPRVRQFNAGIYTLDNASGTSTPVISPNPGPYTSPQTITITDSTSGAVICYTTDGSTPTGNNNGSCTHGTTYSSSFSLTIPGVGATVKAIGTTSGLTDSGVASNTYTLVTAGQPLSFMGGPSIRGGASVK